MPTRTMPRQARSARSLDLILDAAERMFHERGVPETSTVDVATAAGVSVGRLYYWFPDKEAVVQAVIARAEERMRGFLSAVSFDDPDLGVAGVVDQLVPTVGQFFRTHPGTLAVLVQPSLDGSHPARSMRDLLVGSIVALLDRFSPGIDRHEAELVAASIVRVAASFYAEIARASDDDAEVLQAELSYLVTAYVTARCAPLRA